jgi:hypothetical protein
MIITEGRFTFDYVLASPRLRCDYKHLFGVPIAISRRLQPSDIMQRLVNQGLAKVSAKRKDGSISEIYAEKLTIADVESVCLSETDKARIDGWLKRGVK